MALGNFPYTQNDRIIMGILVFLVHLLSIPTICLLRNRNHVFEYLCAATLAIASFMYHFQECLDVMIIMSDVQWHKIDNIFTITGLNNITLSLCNLERHEVLNYKYVSFMVVIIFQEIDPWNLKNTVYPSLMFFYLSLYFLLYKGLPKYNFYNLKRGIIILFCAFAFFTKALNEDTDYMRLFHWIWHMFCCLSVFFLFQLKEDQTYFPIEQIATYINRGKYIL
jgi:hypothetical protein